MASVLVSSHPAVQVMTSVQSSTFGRGGLRLQRFVQHVSPKPVRGFDAHRFVVSAVAGISVRGLLQCRTMRPAFDVMGRRRHMQVALASSTSTAAAGVSPADVLAFWFADPSKIFTKNPAFDDEIRARFADTMAEARAGKMRDWEDSKEGCLALVILFDQMHRNLFRGEATAFATDAEALRISKSAIERGFDTGLPTLQRQMLYMPFMHSESLSVQEEGMKHWKSLGDEKVLQFATMHLEDIKKYGRFPGRNAALGRESTPEEVKYLEAGGGY
mmetsp:Transcript_32528/g.76434  ORF Transcript_32528/g.76434 Transcript_32528/m.76434 type:complete len:273 (+) Transcript_32528:70-888(+)